MSHDINLDARSGSPGILPKAKLNSKTIEIFSD